MTTYDDSTDYDDGLSDEDLTDDALMSENERLRARVAELEATAAATPARPPARELSPAEKAEREFAAKLANASSEDEILALHAEANAAMGRVESGLSQDDVDASMEQFKAEILAVDPNDRDAQAKFAAAERAHKIRIGEPVV